MVSQYLQRYGEAQTAFTRGLPAAEDIPDHVYFECADSIEKSGGKRKNALKWYRMLEKHYLDTGTTSSWDALSVSLQKLLIGDAAENNESVFADDLKAWCSYLLTDAAGNSDIEKYIIDTIVPLSSSLTHPWLRAPFTRLLDFIVQHDILPATHGTILSGYTAVESYGMYEDPDVTPIMYSIVMNIYDALSDEKTMQYYEQLKRDNPDAYVIPPFTQTHYKDSQHSGLVYTWYMSLYYPDHPDQFRLIRERYSDMWSEIEDVAASVRKDAKGYGQKVFEEVLQMDQTDNPGWTRKDEFDWLMGRYQRERRDQQKPVGNPDRYDYRERD